MIEQLTIVVPDGAPEDVWLAARAEGVTASEVRAIAQGGRGTWRRILNDKLNGSTFRGNAHTRRGHEREAFLIHWADETVGAVRLNGALLGHPAHALHLATPDALGWNSDMGGFGVEVKSHDRGWTRTDVPREHADQMQWGMHVTGFDQWLYVWEVMGEDGEPTLADPSHLWVPRDDTRIHQLVAEADRFLAWRAEGAPEFDEISDELDDAIAASADAKTRRLAAAAEEKVANDTLLSLINRVDGASGDGYKAAGTRGQVTYSVTFRDVLDEDAWQRAEPESYDEWRDLSARLEEQAANAAELYSRTSISTRLNVYPAKEQKA